MRPIVRDGVFCLSVCHSSEPCKNDRDTIWLRTRVGPRKHVLDGGAHWRHLTNTIEPCMCVFVRLLWPPVIVVVSLIGGCCVQVGLLARVRALWKQAKSPAESRRRLLRQVRVALATCQMQHVAAAAGSQLLHVSSFFSQTSNDVVCVSSQPCKTIGGPNKWNLVNK